MVVASAQHEDGAEETTCQDKPCSTHLTRHVIADLGDDYALLHISRHLMHDLWWARPADDKDQGYKVRT